MNSQRYLVIKSLVFAVPDDVMPGAQIGIDDALNMLIQHRAKSSTPVLNHKDGNYVYMTTDYPENTNPELLTFTPETLLAWLQDQPDKRFAGMMATVIYDKDLDALRNCYTATEMVKYEERKAFLTASEKAVRDGAEAAAEKIASETMAPDHVAEILKNIGHQSIADRVVQVGGKFGVDGDGSVHMKEDAEPDPSCGSCDNICQEQCPDEPGVAEKEEESGDE